MGQIRTKLNNITMDETTKKELELFAQWIVNGCGEEICETPATIVENYLKQRGPGRPIKGWSPSSGATDTPNNNIVDDSARSEFP